MFKTVKTQKNWARALPLRNEQLNQGFSPELAISPGQIWFTPEVIIFDAFAVLRDILWLWEFFRKILPVFTFRVFALVILLVLIFGINEGTRTAVATTNTPTAGSLQASFEINTSVNAQVTPIIAWPVPMTYISSYFSGFHQGIDLPQAYGTAVKSYRAGSVIFAGWDGGFGNSVMIRHDNGLVTRYAHLSAINVSSGEVVSGGTMIGKVGSTGFSTGPHLHFEVHGSNGALNPLTVLP